MENALFKNVRFTDADPAGRPESLATMRRQMFQDTEFDAGCIYWRDGRNFR